MGDITKVNPGIDPGWLVLIAGGHSGFQPSTLNPCRMFLARLTALGLIKKQGKGVLTPIWQNACWRKALPIPQGRVWVGRLASYTPE